MRAVLIAIVVVAACGTSSSPGRDQGSSAHAGSEVPVTPPPPPDADPMAAAIADATKILRTVAQRLASIGDACDDSIAELDRLLSGELAADVKRLDTALQDRAVVSRLVRMIADGRETPLRQAWNDATVATMQCKRSSERVHGILHLKSVE